MDSYTRASKAELHLHVIVDGTGATHHRGEEENARTLFLDALDANEGPLNLDLLGPKPPAGERMTVSRTTRCPEAIGGRGDRRLRGWGQLCLVPPPPDTPGNPGHEDDFCNKALGGPANFAKTSLKHVLLLQSPLPPT
jgi:hypothetical protein